MMGRQDGGEAHLFYSFNLDAHVPRDHLLRQIDQVLDLADLRQHLAPFYSHTGRPSVDPEVMIRMLIIGYCFGIRSERRLCEEVHLNLAYRWFCRLGLDNPVPEHSTFSKNRHGRFRASGTCRWLFDGAVREYLEALDGGAEAAPRNVSLTDPQARWTAAPGGPAFYAYSTNYLIDTKHAVIVDVEATAAHRTAEVEVTKTMINRVEARFDLKPQRLIGDMAYGTASMLAWMIDDKGINPHVPVWDKTQRSDDTFSSNDFEWNEEAATSRRPTPSSFGRPSQTARSVR